MAVLLTRTDDFVETSKPGYYCIDSCSTISRILSPPVVPGAAKIVCATNEKWSEDARKDEKPFASDNTENRPDSRVR